MQVTALDEADKKVDWFFIYKVPQLSAGACPSPKLRTRRFSPCNMLHDVFVCY
jgi:hypothetical protein